MILSLSAAELQSRSIWWSRAEQNRTEPAAAATHVELSGFSRLKRQEEILRNNFKHSCFNIHGFMWNLIKWTHYQWLSHSVRQLQGSLQVTWAESGPRLCTQHLVVWAPEKSKCWNFFVNLRHDWRRGADLCISSCTERDHRWFNLRLCANEAS